MFQTLARQCRWDYLGVAFGNLNLGSLDLFYHHASGDDCQIGSQRAFTAKPLQKIEIAIVDSTEDFGHKLVSGGFVDINFKGMGSLLDDL